MMDPSLSSIFSEARLIDDPDRRDDYITKACGDNSELLAETRQLIRSHLDSTGTFSQPFAVLPEIAASRMKVIEPEQPLPRQFGNYVLEEVIGQGGMGIVYRGTQTQLDRVVALKMIKGACFATRQEISRFYAEAQSVAGLTHPGIVPVFEAGNIGGQHFFSMGYVRGTDLAEAVRDKKISLDQSLYIIKRIIRAVAYAHAQGVVHRDLKPENILLSFNTCRTDDPAYYEPHISDFGLARRLDQNLGLTIAGEILGTPAYMSPEQASGQHAEVMETTDVYSIGALMYFALAGHPPFEGKTVLDILRKVKDEDPKPLTSAAPSTPKDIGTICQKCLEKKTSKRYPSATQVLLDVENYEGNRPLTAKREGPATRFLKMCQRHPTATLTWVLAALLIGSAITFPLIIASSSRRYAAELAKANTYLKQKQARSELDHGLLLNTGDGKEAALRKFISAAKIAVSSGDQKTEDIARYNIDALSMNLWSHGMTFPSPGGIRVFQPSPDGKQLAIVSQDVTLRIYDTSDGRVLFEKKLRPAISAATFHPSGHIFAASCSDGKIRLWKQAGKTYVFDGHIITNQSDIMGSPRIENMGFSSDGTTIFTSAKDKKTYFWDFQKRSQAREPLLHEHKVISTKFSAGTNLIVSLFRDGRIYGWDAGSGEKRFGPVSLDGNLVGGAVSQRGKRILAIHETSHSGLLYDLEDCGLNACELRETGRVEHKGVLNFAQFSHKSGNVLTSSSDNTLRFRNLGSQRQSCYPLKFLGAVHKFELTGNEETLFTMHRNSEKVATWSPPTIWNNCLSTPHKPGQGAIALAGTRGSIVSLHRHTLTLMPSPLGQQIPNTTRRLSGTLTSVLSDHQRKRIFVSAKNSQDSFYCLDAKGLDILWSTDILQHEPTEMCQSHDGRYLALLSQRLNNDTDTNLSVIDLESKKVATLTVPRKDLYAAAFSSLNPSQLIVSSYRNDLAWFDWEKGEIVREQPADSALIYSIDVCHEKGWVVVGEHDRTATVFREDTWEKMSPKVMHDERVGIVRFAGDGTFVVSGGRNNVAKIWEVSTGLTIGSPLTNHKRILTIDVCDKSRTILTGCAGGKIRVWPIPQKDGRDISAIEASLDSRFFTDF